MTPAQTRRRTVAAFAFVVCASVSAAGVVFTFATARLPFDDAIFNLGQALLAVGYPAVGSVIVSRHPKNGCGWILMAVGFLQGITATAYAYSFYVAEAGPRVAAAPGVMLWLSNWVWFPSLALLATFLLLLLPDGRLLSAKWRPFAGAIAVFIAVGTAAVAHQATPLLHTADPADDEAGLLIAALLFGLLISGAGSVASLIVRYRRSAGVGRQQLKWLAYGGAAAFGGVLLAFVPVSGAWFMAPVLVLMLALPVSVGVAIVRHGLFDIDRLISRTVTYLPLTGTLAGVYGAAVVLLHRILGPLTGDSQVAVAGSTLAVAALFRPARRRIQDIVDRRFNRARYNAQRVVESFSADLRNEVNLQHLTDELLGVVESTVAPQRAAVWLRP